MKLRSDCQLYAIGMKGWVELRVGKKPPKATVTFCSKTIQISQHARNYVPMLRADGTIYGYNWVDKPDGVKPHRITLKTVTWDGGRVVGSVPFRRFKLLANVSVLNGMVREVPANRVSTILMEAQNNG